MDDFEGVRVQWHHLATQTFLGGFVAGLQTSDDHQTTHQFLWTFAQRFQRCEHDATSHGSPERSTIKSRYSRWLKDAFLVRKIDLLYKPL
jgi:hypothetical protein